MFGKVIHSWKRALKGLEFLFKRLVMFILRLGFTTKGGEARKQERKKDIRRILCLRFDKLGDMVVSLPVFETLSQVRPEIDIEVLASRGNQALIAHDSRISAVWLYTKRPWRDFKTLLTLRKRRYDTIIDMICLDSVTSLFVSQFVGRHGQRIGIGKTRFKKYYTDHVPLNSDDYEHIVDTTLKTLRFLDIDQSQFICQAPLRLSPDNRQKADDFLCSLRETGRNSDNGVIGVNISAGKPNRIWQNEKFAELIDKLNDSPEPVTVLILCAPDDRKRAEAVRRRTTSPTAIVPDDLSIMEVSAIIAGLDMLITPDTSLIHIARQFDTPVVGIYPTHGRSTAQWSPYGQTDGLVQGGSECDIHDITAEQVFEEYRRVSQRTGQMTAG